MDISIFDLFSIGIGPSSSHTVGPMRAAFKFSQNYLAKFAISQIDKIEVDLYGSLALTGKGHATDIAIILGLSGFLPEMVDPNEVPKIVACTLESQSIFFQQQQYIQFNPLQNIVFHRTKQLPFHPNAMRLKIAVKDNLVFEQIFYSTGGGFIVEHSEAVEKGSTSNIHPKTIPYYFESARALLKLCDDQNMSIAELMMENEKSWLTDREVRLGLINIWKVMQECIKRGTLESGILPGGLGVKRRAKGILEKLQAQQIRTGNKVSDHAEILDWVSLWALAVNEENAAGGRVVTAPTNGAAGVIPAVIKYLEMFGDNFTEDDVVTFMLVAAAIGILYKKGASISAAEMGCMGEVGVASSMAAAGLCAVMGGDNRQIANAAEIAMEHHLGLTCDPVAGLVQIPCIERNTMGACKAINAARLAVLYGDGSHSVSLDEVIAAMKQTGDDMKDSYKETSLGGLAVNVPFC